MFEGLKEDMRAAKERDLLQENIEIFSHIQDFTLWWYKLSHWLWKKKSPPTWKILLNIGRFFTGIEIHPGATIGKDSS